MFEYLSSPTADRPRYDLYDGIPDANGRLFDRPTRLHLEREELELLREACRANWREVQPSIFGFRLQGVLGRDMPWKLGAHYTRESEIQKIVSVVPTGCSSRWLVRPTSLVEVVQRDGEGVVSDHDRRDLDPLHGVVGCLGRLST